MSDDNLAPWYEIEVADTPLGTGLTRLVTEVAVEYADSALWMAELKIQDKDMQVLASKVFQYGNDLDVWMGFGATLHHMGRFIIARVGATFPADGPPGVTVRAYTADWRMTSNGPDGAKRGRALGKPNQGVKTKTTKSASSVVTRDVAGKLHLVSKAKQSSTGAKRTQHDRRFENVTYEEAVARVAGTYGFDIDIDPTGIPPKTFYQDAKMEDYQFVRGIANLVGFLFWVDGDADGNWTLHLKNPVNGNTVLPEVQEKKYTFRYGITDASLVDFSPEGSIVQEKTKIRVTYFDPTTGKTIEQEIDDDGLAPDLLYEGDPKATLKKGAESGGAVRLFFNDFSIQTVANRTFDNAAELRAWATQWFRRNRENFQTGRGKVVGVSDLRCFQIHELDGIATWSGDWYFARARHVMNSEGGYLVDFTARKVVR